MLIAVLVLGLISVAFKKDDLPANQVLVSVLVSVAFIEK